ncbi:hypothetical protein BJV78DRAFT_1275098 [Lactifluus subvellereus]|nr:hypothetical protein BJV78DRAFT_1275098 [Lactifluus subvellereus]
MFALHPNRSLLNPKFDGYKLDPISSEDTVARHVLPHKATQASVSGRHHFSFQEAQSRIRHNHLCVSPEGEHTVYIDTDLRVILVRLDHPSFTAIYDIPRPMQTPESESFQREYPSSVFVDRQTVICADGYGTLHVLTTSSIDSAQLLGVYELPRSLKSPSSSSPPFRLHAALSADGQAAVAVLSFKCLEEEPPGTSFSWKTPSIEFDVVAVRVPLHAANDSKAVHPLDVLWHRKGANVPLYVAYERRRNVFILAGGSPYRPIGHPTISRTESSPDEIAPIPRADDDDNMSAPAAASPPNPPPPYAWTQDSEEVTIAIPLPSTTSKTDINVLFSPQSLTVLVRDNSSSSSGSSPPPHYAATRLWGGIAPSSSFWTWDAHGARSYGLLTLHLEKQHAGTRWPHVFDASAAGSGQQPEVAETLDPSELYAIRESLEKYTTAMQEGGVAAAAAARPSLADGEVDEEVDATVGTEVCITWVGGGADPDPDPDLVAWAREDWDVPFTVLSTPLPGIAGDDEISLVVRHTIDGLSFVLSSSSDEDAASGSLPAWTHASTFSALAFVLASKRDTRFTYHVPSKAVLAFEGGGADYGGNLYIYRNAKPKSNVAKQAILKLTGNASGSLLGVGATRIGGQTIILCLCEKELLVLQNVL